MSARLTNRIVGLAAGRNFLKDNEVNLMICLLKIYACAVKEKNLTQTLRHEIPKTLLNISCLDLKGQKALTLTNEWQKPTYSDSQRAAPAQTGFGRKQQPAKR